MHGFISPTCLAPARVGASARLSEFSPPARYFQIRKLRLRASITRPCWHMEKRKEPAYSKFVSDLHHLNAQQSAQPRRAGLGQQASACRCCYACTDTLYRPAAGTRLLPGEEQSSGRNIGCLVCYFELMTQILARCRAGRGRGCERRTTERMKITTMATALNSAPHYFSENLFSDTGDNR